MPHQEVDNTIQEIIDTITEIDCVLYDPETQMFDPCLVGEQLVVVNGKFCLITINRISKKFVRFIKDVPTRITLDQVRNSISDPLERNVLETDWRLFLISYLKQVDIESISIDDIYLLGSILKNTMESSPCSDMYLNGSSSREEKQIRFFLRAIKAGIFPWDEK